MKRRQINRYLADSLQFFSQMKFALPQWATWSPAQWRGQLPQVQEIVDCQLGWDITDFAGGNLMVQLYGATADDQLSDEPITLSVDGFCRTVAAGSTITLHPGESVTLDQRVYHRFYGEVGKGKVLVGEVSSVNDDSCDNRFLTAPGRFPAIDEDEAPLYLLSTDYRNYL